MSSEFEDVLNEIQSFSGDREWSQFHTPKNLVLSIVSEIGELAEIVQWKSDLELIEYLQTAKGRKELSEEIADISIYLLRLCQQQNLDFLKIIKDKIKINSSNYPIAKSKGTSLKYTEL